MGLAPSNGTQATHERLAYIACSFCAHASDAKTRTQTQKRCVAFPCVSLWHARQTMAVDVCLKSSRVSSNIVVVDHFLMRRMRSRRGVVLRPTENQLQRVSHVACRNIMPDVINLHGGRGVAGMEFVIRAVRSSGG